MIELCVEFLNLYVIGNNVVDENIPAGHNNNCSYFIFMKALLCDGNCAAGPPAGIYVITPLQILPLPPRW